MGMAPAMVIAMVATARAATREAAHAVVASNGRGGWTHTIESTLGGKRCSVHNGRRRQNEKRSNETAKSSRRITPTLC
jgi:hypothetical protein